MTTRTGTVAAARMLGGERPGAENAYDTGLIPNG